MAEVSFGSGGSKFNFSGVGNSNDQSQGSEPVDFLKAGESQSTLGRVARGVGNFALNAVTPSEIKNVFRPPQQQFDYSQISEKLGDVQKNTKQIYENIMTLKGPGVTPEQRAQFTPGLQLELAKNYGEYAHLVANTAMGLGNDYNPEMFDGYNKIFDELGEMSGMGRIEAKNMNSALLGRTHIHDKTNDPRQDPKTAHFNWYSTPLGFGRAKNPNEASPEGLAIYTSDDLKNHEGYLRPIPLTREEWESEGYRAHGVMEGPTTESGVRNYLFPFNHPIHEKFAPGKRQGMEAEELFSQEPTKPSLPLGMPSAPEQQAEMKPAALEPGQVPTGSIFQISQQLSNVTPDAMLQMVSDVDTDIDTGVPQFDRPAMAEKAVQNPHEKPCRCSGN